MALENNLTDDVMYERFSKRPSFESGNEPDINIYGLKPTEIQGDYNYRTKGPEYEIEGGGKAKNFAISYTVMGNGNSIEEIFKPESTTPIYVFLHGVPTNRRQWWPVQRRVARFFPTLSLDLLGMGESDKPLDYPNWSWKDDTVYMKKMFDEFGITGEEHKRLIFVADDWGGGPLAHYTAEYDEDVRGWVSLDPIALDGYPVNEIQAIGRASALPMSKDREEGLSFEEAMGSFDQTLVQIFKTMVHRPNEVYNQYTLRNITFPYIDVDYERHPRSDKTLPVFSTLTPKMKDLDGYATSMSLGLNMHAIRVLSQRAAMLSSAQLLPFHSTKNKFGVQYSKSTAPGMIMWGEYDNMMPSNQAFRFPMMYFNSVGIEKQMIPRAGHFAATDQPDIVAENIISFGYRIIEAYSEYYTTPFFGFTGIWKGDESKIIDDCIDRHIYKDEYDDLYV
jgi:pimeloyl-ACP methyl ester carboxylesterase